MFIVKTWNFTKKTRKVLTLQKEPFTDVSKVIVFQNLGKLTKKTPTLESLFNKVCRPQSGSLLKKIPRQKCFFCEFCEVFENSFFIGDFNGNFERVFVCVITLEATFQKNLPKSRKFSGEASVVEFHYSETSVFGIHINFKYNPKTYDIVKLCSDSLKLYLSFDSSFFSI